MKNYELTCLISPELKTDEAEKIAGEISEFLQKEGGLIIKSATADYKALGYIIKKQSACFLMSLDFSLEAEKIKILEEKIKKDQRILRHLITTKKPATEEYKNKRDKKVFTDKKIVSEEEQGKKISKSLYDRDPSAGRLGAEKKVELKDIDEKLEEILKE